MIDTKHVVAELYNMVNVPTAVWIDESGMIVRPNEVAFALDTFRVITGIDSARYLDALRDCLEQLEGRSRAAIDLQYREHASREAIATRLEMQPDGVKTLLRRTRHVLRECVERKLKNDTTL